MIRTFVRRCTLCSVSAVLLLGAAPSLGQAGWSKQAPIPTNEDLHAVAVISDSEFWICGGSGLLVHTTDGGLNWEERQVATTSMWALDFLDAQRGWAAGNGFFHTVDGGQTWITDNNWGSIYDLQFVDAQRGFACGNGGVTYRTTNGGQTWSYQPVGTIATLSSIFFVDAITGWTVDIDGRIYRSVDGAQSWALQHDANGYLSTLQFFDAQDGWAIGGDMFLHTVNGGQTWTPASVPPGTWSHAARFSDRQHGVSVGEYGNVTVTSDFGASWTMIAPIGSGPRLWDVESWNASISIYSGETGGLARTATGGATWNALQSGGTGNTHGIDAVDALHAWAANDGGEVLYTQNGGAHWQRVVVSGFDNYGRVEDVDFFDTQLGWAVGQHEFFGGNSGQIVRSTDGGVNWQLQDSRPSVYYHDVEVLDAQTVLALGEVPLGPRIILRTSDGGQSWSDVGPSQAVFRDADFINASIGWAVGGLIYKSTDGGQSWVQQGAAPPDLLYAVSFADALNGWAVGWSSTILHTSDGGQNWHLQSISTTSHVFLDVQAFSPSTALICGADGFVARTDDGGQSWVADVVASSAGTFESLCFLAPDRGWVGGDGIWHSGGTYQAPIAYCTAGTTSHGCVPAISAVGTPSATASSGFSIAVDQVEGQRQGLIFYGTSGRVAVAWGPGSSFLCVKTPTQRTSPRSSAGTLLSCDGVLALDWNSWLQTHPFALGVPFSAGQRVWAQAWFRDPPAAKTTNLSNALEFMLAP